MKQLIWPSRKSVKKKTSPLERRKFIDAEEVQGNVGESTQLTDSVVPETSEEVIGQVAKEPPVDLGKSSTSVRKQLEETPFVLAPPEEEIEVLRQDVGKQTTQEKKKEHKSCRIQRPARSKEVDNPLFNSEKFVFSMKPVKPEICTLSQVRRWARQNAVEELWICKLALCKQESTQSSDGQADGAGGTQSPLPSEQLKANGGQ